MPESKEKQENKHVVQANQPNWCTVGDPNHFAFGQVEWIATEGDARASFNKHVRMLIGSTDPAYMADPTYINQRKIVFLFFAARQDRGWLVKGPEHQPQARLPQYGDRWFARGVSRLANLHTTYRVCSWTPIEGHPIV